MASNQDEFSDIIVTPAASIKTQPWWLKLHEVIIAAFLHKPENATVFPPDWKRLAEDPATAVQNLASEFGESGHLAVMFDHEQPVACGGVLPYRGDSWINDAQSGKSDADIANAGPTNSPPPAGDGAAEWEVCCFCVSPSHRGQGLSYRLLPFLEDFIKHRGAKHLYASYAGIETGNFWPRMGFGVIPNAGGTLKKGFKVDPEKEGLRGDVVFSMAVKTL